MQKQIQQTHAPDGSDVNVRHILHIVKDVFQHTDPSMDGDPAAYGYIHSSEDDTSEAVRNGMLGASAFIIKKVAREIAYKCSGEGDAHSTTMSLLHMLSNYSWDAKLVITLAALAITYGEFWLVVELYPTNPLAQSVTVLKQIPNLVEHPDALAARLDEIINLINAMLNVIQKIVEFRHLPYQYISPEEMPFSMAMELIPMASYWTIRSVVACASWIDKLIGFSYEYITSTTKAWELTSLTHNEKKIHYRLMQQLHLCYQHIDEKKHEEELHQQENIRILKGMIKCRDGIQPLIEGSTKSRVDFESLRSETLLLLISALDVSPEEIRTLDRLEVIYRQSRTRSELQYEIVWLPIVNNTTSLTTENQKSFEQLQSKMPWYSLYDPKLIEPEAVRHIKEEWGFVKRPILVTLQGTVACKDALPMFFIWGNTAFPFTAIKEKALWREEIWRPELLMAHIDSDILIWIEQRKNICIYGGEDIDWIRRFTTAAKEVTVAAGIELELVYVGTSSHVGLSKILAFIQQEKLSYCWTDLTSYWYFWKRIECMLYSKILQGKNVESDHIMQEASIMLTFDGSDTGWAILCCGSSEMAIANGDMILESFGRFDEWKENARVKGFVIALEEHLQKLIFPYRYWTIHVRTAGLVECGRTMDGDFMHCSGSD